MTVREMLTQSTDPLERLMLSNLIECGHSDSKVTRLHDELIVEYVMPARLPVTELNIHIDLSEPVTELKSWPCTTPNWVKEPT